MRVGQSVLTTRPPAPTFAQCRVPQTSRFSSERYFTTVHVNARFEGCDPSQAPTVSSACR